MKKKIVLRGKRKLYIVIFVILLVLPWVLGGFLRVTVPDVYFAMSDSSREKRSKSDIDLRELWSSGESVSAFIDDRVPFRNTMIIWYQSIDNLISNSYQKAANALIGKMYPVEDDEISVSEIESDDSEEMQEAAPHQVEYMVPIIKGQTVEGREGWLFLASENELQYYVADNMLSEEEMANYSKIVASLKQLCESQGKQFYFMITPNKSQVYDRYMPSFEIQSRYKRVQCLKDYLYDNAGVDMIYPLTELMQMSDVTQVYYKYDTHWNLPGAFVGTQALYSAMGLPTSDLYDWQGTWKVTEEMDLCDLGYIPRDSVEPDKDYFFDYKPQITVNGLNLDKMVLRTTSNSENQTNFVMISDSYRVNMEPILTKDFSNCTIAHRDYISSCEEDLKNADIIVVSMVERYDYEAFNAMEKIIKILGK